MALPECDVMIDFETLSTKKDAVLLSCGIVVFNEEEIKRVHYTEFDVLNQIAEGRRVSRDTVDWWNKTNNSELKRLLFSSGGATESPRKWVEAVLDEIRSIHGIRYYWSRHDMDFKILNSLIEKKVHFSKYKDVATLDVFNVPYVSNNHNALEDCKNQVEYVQEVMRIWSTARSVVMN